MTATASLTPTVRVGLRRSAFWAVYAVGALVVAVIIIALTGTSTGPSAPLEADSAAPSGSQALVRVLGEHGVTVTAVTTRDEARRALEGGGATLLVYDSGGYLPEGDLAGLVEAAASSVVVEPGFLALQSIAPGVDAGGHEPADGAPVAAGCEVPAAQRAQTSEPFATYRIDSSSPATGCFPVGNGRVGLVSIPHGDGTLTLLGNSRVLTNERIVGGGNAALALGLLGGSDTLVWYLPSLSDAETTGPPSLGELTPRWVVPVAALLAITAFAAMLWRGRRFGPVVVENLPVTVPARETMEGRARLYERTGSRLRALDTLRIGATGRLARLLGMPRTATVWEIADAAASVLGTNPDQTRRILIDAVPSRDAELLALSDELSELERRVRRATDETGRMNP